MNDVVVLVPTCVHPVLPSGERWILYDVALATAVQLTPICEALTDVAVTPVGAAGAGGPPPRKTPEMTAFRPAVCVTVIVTVPPAPTLTGAFTHAPPEKSVVMFAACGPEPSLIVMVSRRPVVSQSSAYRCIVPLNALENVRCRRTWLASYQLDAWRVVASGLCSACTAVVEPLHSNRWPLSRVRVMPGSETRSLLPFQPSSA